MNMPNVPIEASVMFVVAIATLAFNLLLFTNVKPERWNFIHTMCAFSSFGVFMLVLGYCIGTLPKTLPSISCFAIGVVAVTVSFGHLNTAADNLQKKR